MLHSKLFGKTLREAPADEVSVNAKLLVRAGFIDKLMAGSYSFLPLGLRVLDKIADIIREEMNNIDGQELLLPALHPKDNWEKTGRWKDPGRETMFQLTGRGDRDYGLGWTHEEIITPLAKKFVNSYKDLPLALYQIQTKFRDEPRAKSGLLRGREFLMKDLYSFHTNEKDLDEFYDTALKAYGQIFKRIGLDALVVEASGGTFSKYSHEFQTPTPAGEDIVMICDACDFAQNRDIAKVTAGDKCPKCKKQIKAQRAIEVGNIFKLKTKYSKSFNLAYKDEQGNSQLALMGCYGIGLGRVLGAVVETSHDKHGIIWPDSIAPFDIHLIALQENKEIHIAGEKAYAALQKIGRGVLYDDRLDLSAGEKLTEADLIGIPYRAVISEKTLAKNSVEIKKRGEKKAKLIRIKDIVKNLD